MPKLSADEISLLKAYERGEFKSLPREEHARYRQYARETFRKDKRVNIRLSSKDLQDLRKKAVAEGLPYQTLMASVLHKFVTGLLVPRKA